MSFSSDDDLEFSVSLKEGASKQRSTVEYADEQNSIDINSDSVSLTSRDFELPEDAIITTNIPSGGKLREVLNSGDIKALSAAHESHRLCSQCTSASAELKEASVYCDTCQQAVCLGCLAKDVIHANHTLRPFDSHSSSDGPVYSDSVTLTGIGYFDYVTLPEIGSPGSMKLSQRQHALDGCQTAQHAQSSPMPIPGAQGVAGKASAVSEDNRSDVMTLTGSADTLPSPSEAASEFDTSAAAAFSKTVDGRVRATTISIQLHGKKWREDSDRFKETCITALCDQSKARGEFLKASFSKSSHRKRKTESNSETMLDFRGVDKKPSFLASENSLGSLLTPLQVECTLDFSWKRRGIFFKSPPAPPSHCVVLLHASAHTPKRYSLKATLIESLGPQRILYGPLTIDNRQILTKRTLVKDSTNWSSHLASMCALKLSGNEFLYTVTNDSLLIRQKQQMKDDSIGLNLIGEVKVRDDVILAAIAVSSRDHRLAAVSYTCNTWTTMSITIYSVNPDGSLSEEDKSPQIPRIASPQDNKNVCESPPISGVEDLDIGHCSPRVKAAGGMGELASQARSIGQTVKDRHSLTWSTFSDDVFVSCSKGYICRVQARAPWRVVWTKDMTSPTNIFCLDGFLYVTESREKKVQVLSTSDGQSLWSYDCVGVPASVLQNEEGGIVTICI